jgi:hypothetical protein
MGLAPAEEVVLQSHPSACSPEAEGEEVSMENEKNDPLAEFGLDAIDLQWTMKDIAAKRTWLINQQHVEKLSHSVWPRCAKAFRISRSPAKIRSGTDDVDPNRAPDRQL